MEELLNDLKGKNKAMSKEKLLALLKIQTKVQDDVAADKEVHKCVASGKVLHCKWSSKRVILLIQISFDIIGLQDLPWRCFATGFIYTW